MQIFRGIENIPSYRHKTIVALGNFDGLHIGHQKILSALGEISKKRKKRSVVLTFFPHPSNIVGSKPIPMIQTLEQRLHQIGNFPVGMTLVLDFDLKFSRLSSHEFIKGILIQKLNAEIIIVGANFRFGNKQEGSAEMLHNNARHHHYTVLIVPPVRKKGKIVSSSWIRSLLFQGQIHKVNELLGRAYEIEGVVTKGKSRGKNLGFPTANIKTANEILPSGVFLTTARLRGESFPSLTNIGICPTFGEKEKNIETYLIDFDKNIYKKEIYLAFHKKIRSERKFKSSEQLSSQIQKDLGIARDFFTRSFQGYS